MPFRPRIAIIGAGPAGLALGLLLQQRGIHAMIYDLRSKPTAEELAQPSGMLDLHDESGQRVMRECGLWEGFQAAVGDCSESCRVLDSGGKVLHTDEGELSSRPEIPRNALSSLLMGKLDGECTTSSIKWNHKITAVTESRDQVTGATEITLELGGSGSGSVQGRVTCDFVVGADGAWSRVRRLLTEVRPFYSGAQLTTVTVRHASTRFPHLVELNGSGTLQALGRRNGILTHRGPQDSIRVYAVVSTSDERWAHTEGMEGQTASELKTRFLSDDHFFGTWAPSLKDLLATACDEDARDNPYRPADIQPLYMLPVGHRWTHRTGVTLVGDAAHLMTPWAGEGVNLALWDSLDLAHALGGDAVVASTEEGFESGGGLESRSGGTVLLAEDAASWQAAMEPRVRAYEDAMLTRAQGKAEESARNKDLILSENGAQALADLFKTFAEMHQQQESAN